MPTIKKTHSSTCPVDCPRCIQLEFQRRYSQDHRDKNPNPLDKRLKENQSLRSNLTNEKIEKIWKKFEDPDYYTFGRSNKSISTSTLMFEGNTFVKRNGKLCPNKLTF